MENNIQTTIINLMQNIVDKIDQIDKKINQIKNKNNDDTIEEVGLKFKNHLNNLVDAFSYYSEQMKSEMTNRIISSIENNKTIPLTNNYNEYSVFGNKSEIKPKTIFIFIFILFFIWTSVKYLPSFYLEYSTLKKDKESFQMFYEFTYLNQFKNSEETTSNKILDKFYKKDSVQMKEYNHLLDVYTIEMKKRKYTRRIEIIGEKVIAKLQSIAYLNNALNYRERGGSLIATSRCLGNSDEIAPQMENYNRFNDRCLKNTFHIKIRIAPEDKGVLNTQDWVDISNEYANKIGFENNLFAVYIHEENTDKEHIHIVASRIKLNNQAVNDSYTHYKNMDFCREMESKYNLRKVKRVLENVKNKENFIKDDKRIPLIQVKIKQAINHSDSIEDLIFHLTNHGIKTTLGRGIGFTDEKGVYFKGSEIDRKYSLSGIKKLLSYKEQEQSERYNTNILRSRL